MSDDFDKYLAIANQDIQRANNMGELKSYVASLLYDNDKKVDMIHELEEEIERLNNIINKLEKDIKNLYTYGIKNNAEQRDYLLNRLQKLKGR